MNKSILMGLMLLSFGAYAGTTGKPQTMPWHFSTGIGYVNYDNMQDANTTVLRIAGSKDIFDYIIMPGHNIKPAFFGIEIGAQTGLASRLSATQDQLSQIGGPAVQSTINPFFDVMGTGRMPLEVGTWVGKINNIIIQSPLTSWWENETDLLVKVGFAYRQLHFDRGTMSSKNQINPEVQVGLNKLITKHLELGLVYQGIYSGGTNLRIYGTDPETATASVSNVPTQNGGLILMSYRA